MQLEERRRSFNVACGHCFMCANQLMWQCETTQVREYDTGAALLCES